MKSITDNDLYRAARDSGVLIVTKAEEQAAIKFGRAVLALACAELVSDEQAPSPTAGMSIEQRILHVGGRNNAAGYVEFGSTQAVRALVLQVVRDQVVRDPTVAPAKPVATLHDDGYWTAKKTEAGRLLDASLRNAGTRVDVYTAPVAPASKA